LTGSNISVEQHGSDLDPLIGFHLRFPATTATPTAGGSMSSTSASRMITA
jgi:hypothetical protein